MTETIEQTGFGKTAKSERTRQRIIDSAIECLATHGYAATNMSMVAKTAGLTRGSLQYYFPEKRQLMVTVAKEIRQDRADNLEGRMDPKKPLKERLDTLGHHGRNEFGTNFHIAAIELQMATRGDPQLKQLLGPVLAKEYQDADAAFVDWFPDVALSKEELEAFRTITSAIHRGMAIEMLNSENKPVVDLANRLVRQFLDQYFVVATNQPKTKKKKQ